MTDLPHTALKREIVRRLDLIAGPHKLGHQDVSALRYAMRSDHDAPVEIMFEKAADTAAYLWVLAVQVAEIPAGRILSDFYSKEDLYKVPAKNGGMQYGRHAALEKMTWLGRADLVRFDLRSVAEFELVLSALKQARKGGPAR